MNTMDTTKMSGSDTDQLADLMAQKHDCLRNLCDLGRQQLELIGAGDLERLLKLLSAKQRLLVTLQTVETALDPFRDQLPEDRRWASAERREECAALATQCERLLGEIVQQERQSETRLVQHRDQAATRLEGAHVASEARGAYTADFNDSPGQLDLSSEM
jgi:hypothetical protein